MAPTYIRDYLRRQPFQPFRVHITDGTAYEVRHPEMAYVDRMTMIVAVEIGEDELPERSIHIDPRHVARLEPLSNAGSSI